MPDINQNQERNYHNNQNYQIGQNPLNMPLYPSLNQNDDDEYPTEELINSQHQNNNQNYVQKKPEIQERVSDAVAPPIINPEMTTGQPLTQPSQEPKYQLQEVSPAVTNMPVYQLEQERPLRPVRRCLLSRRRIITLIGAAAIIVTAIILAVKYRK